MVLLFGSSWMDVARYIQVKLILLDQQSIGINEKREGVKSDVLFFRGSCINGI